MNAVDYRFFLKVYKLIHLVINVSDIAATELGYNLNSVKRMEITFFVIFPCLSINRRLPFY
jgi:hypothetical protein